MYRWKIRLELLFQVLEQLELDKLCVLLGNLRSFLDKIALVPQVAHAWHKAIHTLVVNSLGRFNLIHHRSLEVGNLLERRRLVFSILMVMVRVEV